MGMVSPGYLRPVQTGPIKPEEDAVISAICPGLGQTVEADDRESDPLWGPYVAMYTSWATDPELRYAGASGGALSAILAYLVETGVVDAVAQVEADRADPIGNAMTISTDREAIRDAAGSRYAPSAPVANLPEWLERHRREGTRFAVVGKPCDAVALAAFRGRDAEVAAAVPVILSFFCAGVPSLRGGGAILQSLQAPADQVIGFRYRGNGWPGQATATLSDGSTRSMSYHDSWGGILTQHLQHRCKICADGTGMAADIVCADAWESNEKGYPIFDEAPGVSLLVSRTRLGEQLVRQAKEAGAIEIAGFDPEALAAIQPGQRERRRALLARLTALRMVGRPIPRYRGLNLAEAAKQNPLRRNLRNFLGTLRRSLHPRNR